MVFNKVAFSDRILMKKLLEQSVYGIFVRTIFPSEKSLNQDIRFTVSCNPTRRQLSMGSIVYSRWFGESALISYENKAQYELHRTACQQTISNKRLVYFYIVCSLKKGKLRYTGRYKRNFPRIKLKKNLRYTTKTFFTRQETISCLSLLSFISVKIEKNHNYPSKSGDRKTTKAAL